MIRRLNYTNRERIKRDDITIALDERHGQIWFDADLSGLEDYGLPSDSFVFLEAYRLSTWMRFDYGQLGNLVPSENRHLERFVSAEGIKFRVKVTAAGDTHKLLAVANAIPLLLPGQDENPREPLLHVLPEEEMGDEIYRLEFTPEHPVLLINNKDGDYRGIGRSPAFLSLAIPAVLHGILTRIILIEHKRDDDDADDWRCQWITFIKQLPGLGEIPATDEIDACTEWIGDAVAAFARNRKTWAKFMEFWKEEA